MPKKLSQSPLLRADPADLPPYRKGSKGEFGGFLKYIRAVNPGPPPFGWKDITPYFGSQHVDIGKYRILAEKAGYLLAKQQVTEGRRTYRRIAVASNSHHPTMENSK